MKKKGFTLVELLAVIAILAILVIIALPNVMGMFNTAKENSFYTEVKEIYKTAQNKWMLDNMSSANAAKIYNRSNMASELSGRDDIQFSITIDSAGNVTRYAATDGTFWYVATSDALKVEDIDKADGGKWADGTPQCQCQGATSASACSTSDMTDFANCGKK